MSKKIYESERRQRRVDYKKFKEEYKQCITEEDEDDLLYFDIQLDGMFTDMVRKEVYKYIRNIPNICTVTTMSYMTSAKRVRRVLKSLDGGDGIKGYRSENVPVMKPLAEYICNKVLHFIANIPIGFKRYVDNEYGASQYYVNENGVVIKWNRKYMKLHTNERGYLIVCLSFKKGDKFIEKHRSIHRMVATTYHPNYKNKRDVNHIDGNKQNNYKDNLEWATNYENVRHAIETGLRIDHNYLKNDVHSKLCESYKTYMKQIKDKMRNKYNNDASLNFEEKGTIQYGYRDSTITLDRLTPEIRATEKYQHDIKQADINRELTKGSAFIRKKLMSDFNLSKPGITKALKRCKGLSTILRQKY